MKNIVLKGFSKIQIIFKPILSRFSDVAPRPVWADDYNNRGLDARATCVWITLSPSFYYTFSLLHAKNSQYEVEEGPMYEAGMTD